MINEHMFDGAYAGFILHTADYRGDHAWDAETVVYASKGTTVGELYAYLKKQVSSNEPVASLVLNTRHSEREKKK